MITRHRSFIQNRFEAKKFLLKISFVCGFNLYYMDATSPTAAVQVTNDGGEQTMLNGVCDWANEEENIKGKYRH